MPEFLPFPGIRYSPSTCDIALVTAPPYDVIDEREREHLLAQDPHNIVRVDLPAESEGPDRYDHAARTFQTWLRDGILERDTAGSFYVYRMDYVDDSGAPAHTLGVLGALRLSHPGEGSILPHEHTTPKAKTDRLDLLRASRVNLSAIWGLSLAEGLTDLCRCDADPNATWADPDGVRHSLWTVDDPETCEAIAAAVSAAPIVVADGHHRYETSVTYWDERREAADNPEGAAFAMVYVVELTDSELCVRPIHRLLKVADPELLRGQLGKFFSFVDAGRVDGSITERMRQSGGLTLVSPDGTGAFLIPRDGMFEGVDALDSSYLAHALDELDEVEVRYQHGVEQVLEALDRDEADFGVLLRPATVQQIEDNAHSGNRMPPKTTFFHPKPRTGVVFRSTD